MALFSPVPLTALYTSSAKPTLSHSFKPHLTLLLLKKSPHLPSSSLFLARSADNSSGTLGSAVITEEEKLERKKEEQDETLPTPEKKEEEGGKSVENNSNGATAVKAEVQILSFKDPRWVGGTWDLKQFYKNGSTDWDAVIDAEARRRKWLEDNPESSSNDEPVAFDTSIVPWWAWMKRFHLPEAELLNGRAAMIGFFMAYFVDSLTGVGLVDQMGNFFCKTMLFIAVAGVLFIRKNEDIENLKKLFDETTFYDKQWQATWQDDESTDANKK